MFVLNNEEKEHVCKVRNFVRLLKIYIVHTNQYNKINTMQLVLGRERGSLYKFSQVNIVF